MELQAEGPGESGLGGSEASELVRDFLFATDGNWT